MCEPMAPRPLLLTADPGLLEEVLPLAAAAGVHLHLVIEPGAAGDAWLAAPLVLVGEDCLGELTRQRLPRRNGIVLLFPGLDPHTAAWLTGRLREAGGVSGVPR
jgi:hypothetical protein